MIARNDSVNLSWNEASGATEYYAEFWGGPNIILNSGWISNRSWNLGAQWGGSYQWRVKAHNGSGESGWSESRALNIEYGAPSGLTVMSATASQINLSWNASSDGPGNITGYRIYRNGTAVGTVGNDVTAYSDTGLSCVTSYTYAVKAYKDSAESPASNAVDASTAACVPCYTLTTTVIPAGSGSIDISDPLGNCPNGGARYLQGTVLQLIADPGAGYAFANWSGDASGGISAATITMDSDKSVTANFVYSDDVNVLLDPAAPIKGVGEIFEMTIRAQAGSQPVDGADITIGFDPAKLRVVDASGNESTQIVPGTALPDVLGNIANNGTGRITYGAGVLANTPPTDDFAIAIIRFRVIGGANTTTQVQFLAGTEVGYEGQPVTGQMSDSTVTIQPSTFWGRVSLEGRGAAGDSRWHGYPVAVVLHSGSCNNPVAAYDVTTDASGNFTITGMPSGTFYVRVKNTHTVSNCRANVVVPPIGIVDLGTMLEGDANDDDRVSILDFSVLRSGYYQCAGDTGYDDRANFNDDSCVNILDFSLLRTNYYKQGPIMAASASGTVSATPEGTVNLEIAPPVRTASVGQIFTMALNVRAGGATGGWGRCGSGVRSPVSAGGQRRWAGSQPDRSRKRLEHSTTQRGE